MTLLATREFLLIMGLGLIVAGLTTYIITWMLVAVHLRDHHPAEHAAMSGFLFAPHAVGWYLVGRYRSLRDVSLNALAVLGSIGAWAIIAGAVIAITSKLLAYVGAPA
ncbi:MAG TPA: hypothetical protein VGC55_16070 [Dokdonella sp.]